MAVTTNPSPMAVTTNVKVLSLDPFMFDCPPNLFKVTDRYEIISRLLANKAAHIMKGKLTSLIAHKILYINNSHHHFVINQKNKDILDAIIRFWDETPVTALLKDNKMYSHDPTEAQRLCIYAIKSISSDTNNNQDVECNCNTFDCMKDFNDMIDIVRQDCITIKQTTGGRSIERMTEDFIENLVGVIRPNAMPARDNVTCIVKHALWHCDKYTYVDLLTKDCKLLVRSIISIVQKVKAADNETTTKTNKSHCMIQKLTVSTVENIIGQLVKQLF